MIPKIADLNLVLVPKPASTRTGRLGEMALILSHAAKGSPYLTVSKAVRNHFHGLDHVQIIMNERYIAIRPADASDLEARRCNKSGNVAAPDLVRLFAVQRGERFRIPVTYDDGHVLGEIPAELRARYRARKAGQR